MEISNKQQILVFGGAFNPPTLAHQAIMKAGLELPNFRELWVMPSGDRFDKQIDASDNDRLAMLDTIKQSEFDGDKRLCISDFELQLPRPTQTCKTVGALVVAHADIDFWFTFGADSYQSMPSWDSGLELQQSLNMVIIERDDIKTPLRRGIIPVQLSTCDGLSSTEARSAIMAGRPLEGFVCQSVKRYIEERNLYQDSVGER